MRRKVRTGLRRTKNIYLKLTLKHLLRCFDDCIISFKRTAATSSGLSGGGIVNLSLLRDPRRLRYPAPCFLSCLRNRQRHISGERSGWPVQQLGSNMGEVILPRRMFLWCMAVIYLSAFVSLYVQIPGETTLLPAWKLAQLKPPLVCIVSCVSLLGTWRLVLWCFFSVVCGKDPTQSFFAAG